MNVEPFRSFLYYINIVRNTVREKLGFTSCINLKKDRTAFVIGSGPSLNRIDISKLKDKVTISFNRAYIAYEDWDFHPTYYMCVDGIVLPNIKDDINRLIENSRIKKFFLPDWSQGYINKTEKVQFLHIESSHHFGTTYDNLSGISNVAACSIQVLNILGYKDIVLLGTDCRYQEQNLSDVDIDYNPEDKVRRIVYKSKSDSDPNHFCKDYFGAGTEYSKPQQQNHYNGWKFLSKHSPRYKIKIISSSPGSKLHPLFPYADFNKIISKI